jgi:hypothetical protein
MRRRELLAEHHHRFLAGTQDWTGTLSKEQPFDSFPERITVKTECVLYTASAETASGGVNVKLSMRMVNLRDANELSVQQLLPGLDIGVIRFPREELELNVACCAFQAGPATADR